MVLWFAEEVPVVLGTPLKNGVPTGAFFVGVELELALCTVDGVGLMSVLEASIVAGVATPCGARAVTEAFAIGCVELGTTGIVEVPAVSIERSGATKATVAGSELVLVGRPTTPDVDVCPTCCAVLPVRSGRDTGAPVSAVSFMEAVVVKGEAATTASVEVAMVTPLGLPDAVAFAEGASDVSFVSYACVCETLEEPDT